MSSRTEAPGGVVVEIRTASNTRYDPAGKLGMAVAARIAQHSRSGLVLRTPLPGAAGPATPIATVHCPARAVSVHELDYSPWPGAVLVRRARPPGASVGPTGQSTMTSGSESVTPAHGLPLDPRGHPAVAAQPP